MAGEPRHFRNARSFRAWLQKNHGKQTELLLLCVKTHAKGRGVSYHEALDEALCFGWIDGVRRSFDEDFFIQRFTPRKPLSYWSAVNIRKAEGLIAAKRMATPGLKAFAKRDLSAKKRYSFENRPKEFPPEALEKIRANAKASAMFDSLTPGYLRTCAFWVTSPANVATRERRLAALIEAWSRGQKDPTRSKAQPARPRRTPAGSKLA